jgi:hypothetical protein
MRIILFGAQILALIGTAANAKPEPVPKLQIPPPAMNTAHTTPATLPPGKSLLPQARQVGNPTGPVPKSYPWLAAPKLPQAAQVKCVPSATKGC